MYTRPDTRYTCVCLPIYLSIYMVYRAASIFSWVFNLLETGGQTAKWNGYSACSLGWAPAIRLLSAWIILNIAIAMIIIIIIIIVVLVARTAGFAVYKNTHFYVYGVVWQTGGENLVGPPPPHALIIPESEIVFWPAKIYNFVAAPNSICQRYRKVAKKMANFPNCVLCVFLFCFFFFGRPKRDFVYLVGLYELLEITRHGQK